MSKFPIKSIFEQIASHLFNISDLKLAQDFIIEFIQTKDIKETDKKLIIQKTKDQKNIVGLYRYVSNSLLKYEGLGIEVKPIDKKEDLVIIE